MKFRALSGRGVAVLLLLLSLLLLRVFEGLLAGDRVGAAVADATTLDVLSMLPLLNRMLENMGTKKPRRSLGMLSASNSH